MAELLTFPAAPQEQVEPLDAEARSQALDIHRSFLVEAPAGSGKTGLLIQRYLKLLADSSVELPEQVLAITFTNKATAELRERVLGQLELAQADDDGTSVSEFDRQTRALALAVLERDRELNWSLLEHPHRLNLRTIDSVCAEIARTLPILSGSGGRLSPANDAGALHREAARRTLLSLGGGDATFDGALRNLLLHRDGNLAECESLLAEMLSVRDQWGRLIPLGQRELADAWLDADVLPQLERALDHAICVTLTRLERIFPADLLGEITVLASDMARSEGYNGSPSPILSCKGKQESPEAIAEHLDRWRAIVHLLIKPSKPVAWRKSVARNVVKFEIEKHHAAQLKRLIERVSETPGLFDALCAVEQLPPARYPLEQWAVAKSLFRVLSRALVELQLVFAERGECDFTELSLLASHTLGQSSSAEDLAAALGARLQHLLVDEMQDTSTSQYELLELLTASWDGYSQTVFLVGDPRQSIYLFRQARVERFITATQTARLGDVPLTCLRLTANFRSQRTLVDQMNRSFELIFPRTETAAADLAYEPAQSTIGASPNASGAVWHMHALPSAAADEDPARTAAAMRQRQSRDDAGEILRIARDWLARPLPPGRARPWTMAVLVRSRNHLSEIVEALRQSKEALPFKAVEIEVLSERQEILDLAALTRALLHPADRTAGFAVLRAPWCGLSLAELYTLAGGDDASHRHESIARAIAERGHLLADESCERMGRVWNVLEAARTKRARLTTAQLVEHAWLSLGGDTWLTETQLANSRRFFQLLDELDSAGIRVEAATLNDRLRCLYAEPDPIPAGTGYVELLTIHKAKGLEWDVVFVPALERTVAGIRFRLLTWSEIDSVPGTTDGMAHIMLAPIPGKGEGSLALNSWLNGIQRSREAGEAKRLFYVACTRAREELHLFAAPMAAADGTLKPSSDSLLKAAWPAAELYFATAPAAGGGSNVRWAHALDLEDSGASEGESLAIAASSTSNAATLERVPLAFKASLRFEEADARRLPYGEVAVTSHLTDVSFNRPEGSFAARSFGNAIHACADVLAARVQAGDTTATLVSELPGWKKRIAALLRSDGLQPAIVSRLTRDAYDSLSKMLRDPDGIWLLSAHRNANSEFAITSCVGEAEQVSDSLTSATIRVDRIFDAGWEPHAEGGDCLWIIDYKTASPGSANLEEFLDAQRRTYSAQLEAYARILAPAQFKTLQKVRVGLYFPAIPRLLWWEPGAQE